MIWALLETFGGMILRMLGLVVLWLLLFPIVWLISLPVILIVALFREKPYILAVTVLFHTVHVWWRDWGLLLMP